MKRLAKAIAGASLFASSFLAFGSGAYADSPSQQGWWWQGNPGAVPEAGVSVGQPPPDVPAKGLLIEGGSGSATGSGDAAPTAFAAVVYQLASGATPSSLTLTVASGSATTPSTTLELCALSNPGINSEQGGPMSDAPTFSCNTNTTAAPSASGNSYKFDVSKFATGGDLALAVLPTSPTDRVVFSQPDANSLAVAPGGGVSGGFNPQASSAPVGSSVGSPSSSSSSAQAAPAASTASPAASAASPDSAAPAIAGTPTASSSAAPSSTISSTGAGNSATNTSFTSPSSTSDNAKPLAVALIIVAFIVGATTWLAAGRAAARSALNAATTAEA